MTTVLAAKPGEAATKIPLLSWFEECTKDSISLVGGKCASLGELISSGARVPPGFALTTAGFAEFMRAALPVNQVVSAMPISVERNTDTAAVSRPVPSDSNCTVAALGLRSPSSQRML